MNNKRLNEIDILRCIAFVFVVAQHSLCGFCNIEGIGYFDFTIMKLIYVMAKTAVPIFLFISGLSLFYVYSNNFDWKKYYIKRFKYLFIPYVIWSAINMVKLGNTDRFNNFFIQIMAGNGAYHLWYMGMILRLYLIFPIILFISKKIHSMNIKIRIPVFGGLIILYYLVSKYQNIISDKVSVFIFTNPTEVQSRIINISILFWFLYFILGIYFSFNYEYLKEKILKHKRLITVIYILLFVYSYLNEINVIKFVRSLSLLYTVFSIFMFYIISVSLMDKNKIYNSMKFISDYSFTAYMAHIIFINIIVSYIRGTLHIKDYLVIGILTWVSTSIAVPVIINLITYIPYSEYITGIKNRSYKLLDLSNKKSESVIS